MRPSAPVLTTMFSNCSGSRRRPSVVTGIWNAWPAGTGGCPTTPEATWMFCSRSACDDVARRDVADWRAAPGSSQTPHAVLAEPEEVDVADAVDAPEHVAHLDERVVADVELVVALVRREQVHDHQEVGRRLERGDADAPDVLGEARLGDRHAVLHQHLRLVEVGAEPERDRRASSRRRSCSATTCRACLRRRSPPARSASRRCRRRPPAARRGTRPARRSSAARRRDTARRAASGRRSRRG